MADITLSPIHITLTSFRDDLYFTNKQMNLQGPDKWDQYVLEKHLQEWYRNDPTLAPDTAVKGLIWMRERLAEERISEESKFLSDYEQLLRRASIVAKVVSAGNPYGKAFVEAAIEINKELFDYCRKEGSGRDQRTALQDRTNTMAMTMGLERETTLVSQQMGRDNPLFRTAHDANFMAAIGVSLNAREDKIIEANPWLRNHEMIRGLIDDRTNLIRQDVKDAEGRIVFQIKGLNTLVEQQFAGVREELGNIQAAIKHCNDLQLAHFATYVANEAARREAEQAAADRQLRLDAAKSGVYLLSTFVGMADERLGRELYEVGTATIQVVQSLTNWAKTISALKDLANPTALFSTVVMGGNIVSAIMSLVGNQGRTEFDVVREEILAVRKELASLRDEMHRRFDRIDAGLDALFGQILQIRATLEQLETVQRSLNRFESNMHELAAASRDDELWERIGLTLDWREKFPRVGDMPRKTFLEASNLFHNWAVVNSRDAVAIGAASGRRLVDPDSWLTEATKYPLETNLNYFDQFATDVLGVTLFPTSPAANPRDWALGARAYLNVSLDWPQHARQVAATRFHEIHRKGQEIRKALHSVAVNRDLFPSLMRTYRDAVSGHSGLCASLAAAEQGFYAAHETDRRLNHDVLWQSETVPLPVADQMPSWQTIGGRSDDMPALTTPDNATAQALLSASEARAWRMKVIDVRALWDAEWVNRQDVRAGAFGITRKVGESGQLRVNVQLEYALEGEYLPLRKVSYTFPSRIPYFMPYQGLNILAWKFTSSGWDGLKTAFQAGPVQRIESSAAAVRVLSALRQKRQAIQERITYELLKDGEVNKRVNRLTGLVEIARAFVQLGLPRALDSDEKLQALLYGQERLLDARQLKDMLAVPQSPASLRATLTGLANSRSTDLERNLVAHQEQVRKGTYREHYRLVDTTLTQLELAEHVLYPPKLPAAPPDAPTHVTAEPRVNAAVVTWKQPAFDGGTRITAYKVVTLPGRTTIRSNATARRARVSGLKPNTSYTFRVVAVNAAGQSRPSVRSNPVKPRASRQPHRVPA